MMADADIRLYEPMQEEKVIEIELERLRDFHDHPFKIREDRQESGPSIRDSRRERIHTLIQFRSVPDYPEREYPGIVQGKKRMLQPEMRLSGRDRRKTKRIRSLSRSLSRQGIIYTGDTGL